MKIRERAKKELLPRKRDKQRQEATSKGSRAKQRRSRGMLKGVSDGARGCEERDAVSPVLPHRGLLRQQTRASYEAGHDLLTVVRPSASGREAADLTPIHRIGMESQDIRLYSRHPNNSLVKMHLARGRGLSEVETTLS